MSCDVGKVTEGWKMSYDVGEVTESLENEQSSNLSVTLPTSQLILQPFRRFTYVTAQSPTLPLVHLRHSSFSNPSVASPTSQALHLIHLASRPCHKEREVHNEKRKHNEVRHECQRNHFHLRTTCEFDHGWLLRIL